MNKEELRLQKYLARCGIASRRASEKLIQEGKITVNDKVITKMGSKVDPVHDVVKFDGKVIKPNKNDITILLNKPAGYVSTMSDPQGRPCVADLVPISEYPSLFPVGRLDRLTRGMLVFTTNGDLGQELLHPSNEVDKTYEVIIDGKLEAGDKAFANLTSGVNIQSGKTEPSKIEIIEHFGFDKYLEFENEFFKNCAKKNDSGSLPNENELLNKTFTRLTIQIHEGKNRQVRRMFETQGLSVLLLTRISIGNLKLGSLDCGKWAKLNEEDVDLLLGD